MYSTLVHSLKTILQNDPKVKKCICDDTFSNCEEKGKIVCSDQNLEFIHIRFDPCMCEDSKEKRCDCVIFCFNINKEKQGMFVVEVKETYDKPSFSEIIAKIQYCIKTIEDILLGRMSKVEIYPFLCSRKHTSIDRRAALSAPKVKCYGTKKTLILVPHGTNISSYYR